MDKEKRTEICCKLTINPLTPQILSHHARLDHLCLLERAWTGCARSAARAAATGDGPYYVAPACVRYCPCVARPSTRQTMMVNSVSIMKAVFDHYGHL